MTHYQLVAADLDGTLRPERHAIRPRVIDAVRRAQAQGVRVVMATGRTFRTALPFANELGLHDALICDQGATIYDATNGALWFEKRVPVNLTRALLDYAQSNDLTVILCVDNDFYAPRLTEDVKFFVGNFREHLHITNEWDAVLARGAYKLTFVNAADITTRILYDLRAKFGTQLQIVQSYTLYVEITHCDVSKGVAVAWLADRWGIPREQVLTMGDHDNDRSMIEWAGMGVAMGNAVDVLKKVANYIAPSADEDGAAQVLEKFVIREA